METVVSLYLWSRVWLNAEAGNSLWRHHWDIIGAYERLEAYAGRGQNQTRKSIHCPPSHPSSVIILPCTRKEWRRLCIPIATLARLVDANAGLEYP